MKKYPTEFLGRCATCLDNAYLDDLPCKTSDCLVRNAKKIHDEEHATTAQERKDG
jgi:hypothetical protein